MDKEKILSFIEDMIDALTPRSVILMSLLGIFTILGIVTFENRTTIFSKFYDERSIAELSAPWNVTDATKIELRSLANRPLIGGVLLTEVNLKKNRRTTKFWYISDPDFSQQAATVVASLLPQAFFDNDKKNTEQMLAVLNNEFRCVRTDESVFVRYLPDMPKKLPYVCRLAVPPYVGDFAGFITVALVREPNLSERDSLRIELSRISVELYLRDIAKR